MIERELKRRPSHIYPIDEWKLIETRFNPDFLPQAESLFTTANGYLGWRGSFEEDAPVHQPSTLINGFYETWPIVYGEEAFGYAQTGQTIVDVADAKIIKLYVDDERFNLQRAQLEKFERVLDMQNGTLGRELIWRTSTGKRILLRSTRLVSLQQRHLAAIDYQVTPLDQEARVIISSQILNHDRQLANEENEDDQRRHRGFRGRVLLPVLQRNVEQRFILAHQTRKSRLRVAVGADHTVNTNVQYETKAKCEDDLAQFEIKALVKAGQPVKLTKHVAYHNSSRAKASELADRVERTLDLAKERSFSGLVSAQRAYLDSFWRASDIRTVGDPAIQQATRFNVFQILQATAQVGALGIPAKGLTGQGYEGHYFWDTEIYVLPFIIYNLPHVARNLLKFRHSYLEKARQRAREVSQKGALYPWRTISGEEASAYYAAGTAQYHINAAICYAIKKYVEISGDEDFLWHYGAEMVVETARLWADLGCYSPRQEGKFCIHCVTGPDEYNTVVDNNTYTNLMARMNLNYAVWLVEHLKAKQPSVYTDLAHKTQLRPDEVAEWKKAAANMYIPYDEKMGIHPQDDTFLNQEPWDFKNAPADKYPLLLHYHPLVIYRHQVIKQADVVLATFLLEHEFTSEQIKRNFNYYDALTTGDSSLSASIQALVAARLGKRELASRYAKYALLMDLADVARNVADGCHIASMGGTWMGLVYGLAGLRDWGGKISFYPQAPKQLEAIQFSLYIGQSLLGVDLQKETVKYSLRQGEALTFHHGEEEIKLTSAKPECQMPVFGSLAP